MGSNCEDGTIVQMALKTIILPGTTIDDVISAEAFAFAANPSDQAWYIAAATAFGLPPKGCPKDRYLVARVHANSIWRLWQEREPKLESPDVLLKSAIIFELANYLISLNLENSAVINRTPGVRWSRDYFLRTPPNGEEVKKIGRRELEAVRTLLKSEELPRQLELGLRDYLKRVDYRLKLASEKKVLVFNKDRFVLKKVDKTKVYNFLLDTLIFNLTEILVRLLDLTIGGALNIVLHFLNGFVDPSARTNTVHFTKDAVKERRKVYRKKHGGLKAFESTYKHAFEKFT